MKANLYLKSLLAICTLSLLCYATAQKSSFDGPKPMLPDYDESGRELPPGVPRIVDTSGKVIYIKSSFTTKAFQKEALKLVIQEANQVAQELNLQENAPITESNIVESFVGPFGFTYAYKKIGNVTTSNYSYGIEQNNKFSDLTIANWDEHCIKYRKEYQWPASRIDTNGAYQLATQWLAAVHMDVKTMNRECRVRIEISTFWNGLKPGEKFTKKTFVPIYDVFWISPENQVEGYGSVASVGVFAPTKTLLSLTVYDPKYILRKPIVFTNLASLFPGKAVIRTNQPVKTITLPAPPPE
jgi:hypothetical protein